MKNTFKQHVCKLCGKRFLTSTKLKKHGFRNHFEDDIEDESVQFNIKSKDKKVKSNAFCEICEFDYFLGSELKRHNDLRHYKYYVEIKSSNFKNHKG